MSNRTFWLLLAGVLALRTITLPVLPVLDPTEARYAVVARDMLSSGDLVTPMVWANGEYVPFLSKPPLLFWAQAGMMRAAGPQAWAARVPSLAAAVLLVLLAWPVLRRRFSADLARGALLVLVSCPLFFLAAGLGLTDMLLCGSVAGALFSHDAFCRAPERVRARRASLVTFALLGLGMVAKGPIALVLFGLPAAAWSTGRRAPGDFTGQAWWPGGLFFVAPWLPWYVAAERANPGFLAYFLVNENLLRFAASDYGGRYGGGHRFPPGAAFVFLILACLPWLVWLGARLRRADIRRQVCRRLGRGDLRLFALAVILDVAFLSLSRHILGTYVLPVVPAAALLLAAALLAAGIGIERQARLTMGLVTLYAVGIVALQPVVRGRWSTEQVLAAATRVQSDRGAEGRLLFVEKRPFSARFYGGDRIDHIPIDAGNEHYRWYLEPANGHLILLREVHRPLLDTYVTDRLRRVDEVGRHGIYVPVEPEP